MKKILLFGAALSCVILFNSCKAKSSAYKTAYDLARAEQQTTEDWEIDDVETEVVSSPEISYESVKQETVSPHSGEDLTGMKRYSVVIGSFRNSTNAHSLKERMKVEGYYPLIAENEFGWLRVIVVSSDSREEAARARDAIKKKYYPNFQDAWLLERRY